MNDDYSEIINRLGLPLFYNKWGAPHYVLGHRDKKHIRKYFRKIICQECDELFFVEICDPVYQDSMDLLSNYGDPPRHHWRSDCWAGDTMSSCGFNKLTNKEIDALILKSSKFR